METFTETFTILKNAVQFRANALTIVDETPSLTSEPRHDPLILVPQGAKYAHTSSVTPTAGDCDGVTQSLDSHECSNIAPDPGRTDSSEYGQAVIYGQAILTELQNLPSTVKNRKLNADHQSNFFSMPMRSGVWMGEVRIAEVQAEVDR
jgi:hypothetical protein